MKAEALIDSVFHLKPTAESMSWADFVATRFQPGMAYRWKWFATGLEAPFSTQDLERGSFHPDRWVEINSDGSLRIYDTQTEHNERRKVRESIFHLKPTVVAPPPPPFFHVPWNVILHGKVIDTVFYRSTDNITSEEIKRSLVDHDGYDPGIEVRKARRR